MPAVFTYHVISCFCAHTLYGNTSGLVLHVNIMTVDWEISFYCNILLDSCMSSMGKG